MSVRLAELAKLVDGALSGDGSVLITGAAPLSQAGPGQITFADSLGSLHKLAICRATAAIVPAEVSPSNMPFIRVSDPRQAFANVVRRFRPPRGGPSVGISEQASVAPSASLAAGVEVHPQAYVGEDVCIGARTVIHPRVVLMSGCQIGEDVEIFPGATLYENTVVGDRAIIHANAVLGAYGFGYELKEGRHTLAHQIGTVEIGSDVEIGAGTTIDRGSFGPTRIGEGTKIDNLVMIGHNCQIGRHNLLCAQVGIAGSSTTGDYVVMAGQVGVRDHVEIGDGVMIGAQSGVSESISEKGKYLGTPAVPARQEIQTMVVKQKLPEMRKQLAQIQRELFAARGRNDKTL